MDVRNLHGIYQFIYIKVSSFLSFKKRFIHAQTEPFFQKKCPLLVLNIRFLAVFVFGTFIIVVFDRVMAPSAVAWLKTALQRILFNGVPFNGIRCQRFRGMIFAGIILNDVFKTFSATTSG